MLAVSAAAGSIDAAAANLDESRLPAALLPPEVRDPLVDLWTGRLAPSPVFVVQHTAVAGGGVLLAMALHHNVADAATLLPSGQGKCAPLGMRRRLTHLYRALRNCADRRTSARRRHRASN